MRGYLGYISHIVKHRSKGQNICLTTFYCAAFSAHGIETVCIEWNLPLKMGLWGFTLRPRGTITEKDQQTLP